MSIEQTLERIAGALESIASNAVANAQPRLGVQSGEYVPVSFSGAGSMQAYGDTIYVSVGTEFKPLRLSLANIHPRLALYARHPGEPSARPEVQAPAVATPPPETAVKTGSWAEPAVPIPTPAVAPETPQAQVPPPAPEKRTPRQSRKVVEAAAPPPAAQEPAAPPPAAAEPAKVQPLTDLVRNADVPLSATRPAMIGIDTLRTRGARLSAIGLRSELVDMLAKRGAVKFGDLKPEEYPGVWDDMDTIQNAYEDDVRKQGGMPK